MDKRTKSIELALQGSRLADMDDEATDYYVRITEYLIKDGRAKTLDDLDEAMDSMTIEEAEIILGYNVSGYAESAHRAMATDVAMSRLKALEASAGAIMASLRGSTAELPAWVRGKLNTANGSLAEVAAYLIK